MEIFMHSEAWISLLTLTFLEIVLGIDNIIFISIVSFQLNIYYTLNFTCRNPLLFCQIVHEDILHVLTEVFI